MSRPRILIADDEQHIVTLLSMTLRKRGYEVLTADNGTRALELACAFPVDLVIADQTMPGLSGIELAEKLTGTAPVLIVTARPEIRGEDQPNIAGVIHKPFSPNEIATRVRGLVGPAAPPREQSA